MDPLVASSVAPDGGNQGAMMSGMPVFEEI